MKRKLRSLAWFRFTAPLWAVRDAAEHQANWDGTWPSLGYISRCYAAHRRADCMFHTAE